jgi:NAD(P)-dependent dehydrogenase (short-subunit alcohol dehydrogenase family)
MIDLTGQVAAITGAGRGIGREYALLLASRGAAVVVNDIGADVTGEGSDQSVAESVVNEIREASGQAVASTDDIASEAGGQAVVDAALDNFGRIDIMIHNAGSLHRAPFAEFPMDAVHKIIATHLFGAFHVGRPSWRAMAAAGYGRMLLTTSVALFGAPDLSAYSAAKAGCVGLARSLALEAERASVDIKVNVIAPTAATRRAAYSHRNDASAASVDEQFGAEMHPRNIAITALPLLAPTCPVNGACIKAGGGVVSSIFSGLTHGWTPDAEMSPEEVAEHLAEALDQNRHSVPASSAEAREITLTRALSSRQA